MGMEFLAPVVALSGAFLFRVRGGLGGKRLGLDATEARLIFACLFGLMGAGLGWGRGHEAGLLLLPSAWFLSSLPGWFDALGMGRDGTSWGVDVAALLLRGLMWVFLPAALLGACGLSPWPLLLAGALCPLAYEMGWRLPLKLPGLLRGPEVGEAIFGALLGIAMAWGILR